MSRTVPLLRLYASMAWKQTTLLFCLSHYVVTVGLRKGVQLTVQILEAKNG